MVALVVAAVAAVIACEVVVRRDFLVQGDQELVISGLVTSVSSASCPPIVPRPFGYTDAAALGCIAGDG